MSLTTVNVNGKIDLVSGTIFYTEEEMYVMNERIDLSKLNDKQKQSILKTYNAFIEENDRKKKNRNSNRTAVILSKEELQQLLYRRRDKEGDIYMDVDGKSFPDREYVNYNEDTGMIEEWKSGGRVPIRKFVVTDFIPCDGHLQEHVKTELDDQVDYCVGGNCLSWATIHDEAEKNPNSLLGYHTLENGLTFYGMYGTDDCVWPVFFIIYYDGKKLRGYVPREGNQFCKETNEAWGQFCSSDDNDDTEKELYELLDKDKYFNFDKIKADILENIKVKEAK